MKKIRCIITIYLFVVLSLHSGLATEEMGIESFIKADLEGRLDPNLTINTGKNREIFLDEKIKNADPKILLSLISSYNKDTSYSTRRLALLYEVQIANLHPKDQIRHEVVNHLVQAMIEPNSNVFDNAYKLLHTFKKDDFNNNAKELLHNALSKIYPTARVIMICGIADMKEELPRLEELTIDEFEYIKDSNNTLKLYHTAGWAARLARARMGIKEDVKRCIEISESIEDTDERVERVLSLIGYIRQPEVIEYLKKYLESDGHLPSPGQSYASRVMHILAGSLSNFPIKQNKALSYTNEQISLCRKWMSEQKEWQIIR